jgi:ABC-type antimicrobial peptide transport system permease subunit
VNALVTTVKNTTIVLDAFFVVFGVVSILMCFFVLWISFTANVRENGWEFGVLRSLGLTGWQTTRVYVCHSFISVFIN